MKPLHSNHQRCSDASETGLFSVMVSAHSLKVLRQTPKGFVHPVKGSRQTLKGFVHPVEGLRQTLKGFVRPVKGLRQTLKGFVHPMKGLHETLKGFAPPFSAEAAKGTPARDFPLRRSLSGEGPDQELKPQPQHASTAYLG